MANGQSAIDVPSHSPIELRPRLSIWIAQAQLAGSASDTLVAATNKRRWRPQVASRSERLCRWP
jgi:hypothetical protein